MKKLILLRDGPAWLVILGAVFFSLPGRASGDLPAPFVYEPARPGRVLSYPRDHGAHRDSAYEWWYFTGHVLAQPVESSEPVETGGFEVTVFRISPPIGPLSAVPNALRPPQASFLIAQVAVTDLRKGEFRHQTFGMRERLGVAQVSDTDLRIEMPGLRIERLAGGSGEPIAIDARVTDREGQPLEIHLLLDPRKKLALEGDRGFSRKGECSTCASEYATYSRLEGRPGGAVAAQAGRVSAWFDHEFGSNSLDSHEQGWDWFALQLENGWDLMLFQLRHAPGSGAPFLGGSAISPDGRVFPLEPSSIDLKPEGIWKSPHTGSEYPSSWSVRVRMPGPVGADSASRPLLELHLRPLLADQEMGGGGQESAGLATYWEGNCELRDVHGRKQGLAYLEMTGYDSLHRPKF